MRKLICFTKSVSDITFNSMMKVPIIQKPVH